MTKLPKITSPDTLVVLTFAKAGLGHLRVSFALLEGLPKEANSVLFSSRDTATTFMHRLTSTNPILREVAEAFQYGALEHVFTQAYTRALRRKAAKLFPQIKAILEQNKKARHVVFVSTHFGLAHQLGELKPRIEAETGVKVKLVVVVTDDSPQRAWSVPEADLTVVPSKQTKLTLDAPHSQALHYPLSLELGREITQSKQEMRLSQANFKSKAKIKVSLPVSGAAVGLDFYRKLALHLNKLDSRFRFYITSRDSAYTKPFLAQMSSLPFTRVFSYEYDRLVVSNYNKVIHRNTMGFEVTKPSEQAFKSLYGPSQRGGVILLFARPIGRQEHDNLWYLSRNGLIPEKNDQEMLWKLSLKDKHVGKNLLKRARKWRGLRLMSDPAKSSYYIYWCLREGIFSEMMRFSGKEKSNGVNDFWKLVDDII